MGWTPFPNQPRQPADETHSNTPIVAINAALALPTSLAAQNLKPAPENTPDSLEKRFKLMLPNDPEYAWHQFGRRTNLMESPGSRPAAVS